MAQENEYEKISEYLSYDSRSGLVTWIKDKGRAKSGDIAGTIFGSEGYLRLKIFGKNYLVHRIAWLLNYGEFPNEQIDHINHISSDNRLSNLRAVDMVENSKNKSKYKNNTSGVSGVHWNKRSNMWASVISVSGKQVHLGYHVEFSEAVNARKNAEVLYGFHDNNGKG